MVPVKPSDFKKLIVQPEDSLAEAIVKTFVRLPVAVWKLVDYMFTTDGQISSEFEKDLCDIGCSSNEDQGTL